MDATIDFIQDAPIPETLNIQDADYIAKIFSGHNPRKSDEYEDDRKDKESDYNWKEIHRMELQDLEEIVDEEKLDDVIDIKDYDKDEEEDLADIICKELGIDEPSRNKSNKSSNKNKSKNMRSNKRR